MLSAAWSQLKYCDGQSNVFQMLKISPSLTAAIIPWSACSLVVMTTLKILEDDLITLFSVLHRNSNRFSVFRRPLRINKKRHDLKILYVVILPLLWNNLKDDFSPSSSYY